MKNQTIFKLAIAAICVMTCLNTYAATMEDAKHWFAGKAALHKNKGLLYNSYPDRAVFYAIYKNEGGSNLPTTHGCLAPNSFRFVDYPANSNAYSYKVAFAVRDGLDCWGTELCKTNGEYNSAFSPDKLPEFVILHNNCNYSKDKYPQTLANYSNSAMAQKILKANYQQENSKEPEPSPLSDTNSNFKITAAFYGREGQPTWEINGRKIVDIITRNTTNGVIWIPPNMNQYFGGDPLPNQPKIVAVQIQVGNQIINLRQVEGKALQYPGVEGTDYWIVQ